MNNRNPKMVSQITALIRDKLSVDVPAGDIDLVRSGVLDSLALVMLIVAMQEAFGCELPLDNLDLDHFRSAEQIADLVVSTGVVEAG